MIPRLLLVLALVFPSPMAALAAASSSPADVDAKTPEAKQERLLELVGFLKSMSDEDYKELLARQPDQAAIPPQIVSRRTVLSSAYQDLAALEKGRTATPATVEAGSSYSEAGPSAAGGQQEAALGLVAVIALKFLGNAVLNYWLGGGQDLVGGGGRKAGALEQPRQGAGTELASAALGGGGYEQLASAARAPEVAEERSAREKERLQSLADILSSISDEDYRVVLKELPAKSVGHPGLATRRSALGSAYSTLAAMEYREAGALASADYARVSQGAADQLAIHPESLQETGWFTNLLGVAAMGGIGYAIYDNQRRHRRRRAQSVVTTPAPAPTPVEPAPVDPPLRGLPLDAIPGTLALWHFDEGSGTVLQDSAGPNNGLIVNSPEWVPGRVGKALRFNGSNQYVRAKAGLILGGARAFTVEAWVNYEGETGTHPDQFVYGEGSYNDLIDLRLKAGRPDLTILSSNWMENSAREPLSIGEWHHLAGTLESGVGKLYIDGRLAATNPNMGPAIQSGVETDIGRFAGNNGLRYFRGAIDELRVLNVARSADEVAADYRWGLQGAAETTTPPLRCPEGYVWAVDPTWMPTIVPSCRLGESPTLCAARQESARRHNQHLPRCMPASVAGIAGGGTNVSAGFGGLRESLDELDEKLAGGGLSAAQAADLHRRMGSVYEQLASAAAGPVVRPQPRKESVSEEPPAPKRNTKGELDDLEKQMRRELDKRRPN